MLFDDEGNVISRYLPEESFPDRIRRMVKYGDLSATTDPRTLEAVILALLKHIEGLEKDLASAEATLRRHNLGGSIFE